LENLDQPEPETPTETESSPEIEEQVQSVVHEATSEEFTAKIGVKEKIQDWYTEED
jgi:hypothetical protein